MPKSVPIPAFHMHWIDSEHILCNRLLRLAGRCLASEIASERVAAVVLQLLASAIEVGTVDGLAEAAIDHATRNLVALEMEMDRIVLENVGRPRRNPESSDLHLTRI